MLIIKGNITSGSRRQRFRIWHFISFRVSCSVSVCLLKVVVLINKPANRVYEEIYTRFAKSSAVVVLFSILVMGGSLATTSLAIQIKEVNES